MKNHMNIDFISIIIPAYNAEQYIVQSIESVLNQTHKHFEIIAVNDGSTDTTEDLILSISKQYPAKIKYLRQTNKGVSSARNRAIRESRGEYLAFLDADDIWLPNKLESLISAFTENPEVVLCYSDAYSITANGDLGDTLMRHNNPISGMVLPGLLEQNFILTSTVMLKRHCFFESEGFIECIHLGEDYHLWLRIARLWPVHYVNKPLVGYRLNHLGASKNEVAMRKSTISILLEFSAKFPEEYTRFQKHISRGLSNNQYWLGFHYYRSNKFIKAIFSIFRSLLYDSSRVLAWKSFLTLLFIPWPILKNRNISITKTRHSI